MSVPHENRRVTSDTPSRDTLSTFSTPGTRLTPRSISSVTNRSTSAGPTSGYCVYTTSRGYATSGRRSMGIRTYEMKPRKTTARNSIATATGR